MGVCTFRLKNLPLEHIVLTLNTNLMENNNQQIVITDEGKMYLLETAKWAKFLSIVGFVAVGFLALCGVGALVASALMPAGLLGANPYLPLGSAVFVVYAVYFLAIGAIYVFIYYYLYKFAVRTQEAVVSGNTMIMTESQGWMAKYFKFIGVLTIVMLGILALVIVGAVIAVAALAM